VADNNGFKIVIDKEDSPISIDKISVSELDTILGEELVCEDITDYQDGLMKKLKEARSKCHDNHCNLQEVILKEIVIIKRLIYWVDILSSVCDKTPN